jgi:uncharacterized membrane protein YgaE (UPF0421/DUF939 family)
MIVPWVQKHLKHHGWRPLIIATRCALAALGAVEVSWRFGLNYPIYALIAAILVTEYHGEETRQQSVTRLLGNALGITAGCLLVTLFGSHSWVIGFAAFLMILFCYYFDFAVAAKYSAFVAALTVMDHSSHPWSYGRDRFLETLIGVGFAVLMSLAIPVPKPKAGAKTATGKTAND